MQISLKLRNHTRKVDIFDEKFDVCPAFDLKDFTNGSMTTTLNQLIPENAHQNHTFMDLLKGTIVTQNSLSKYLSPKFAFAVMLRVRKSDPTPPSSSSPGPDSSLPLKAISEISLVNFLVGPPDETPPAYEIKPAHRPNVDDFSANAFYYTRVFSPSKTQLELGTGGGIGITRDGYLGPDVRGKVTTTLLLTGSGLGSLAYYQPGCYDCNDGYDVAKYGHQDGVFSGLGDGVSFAGDELDVAVNATFIILYM
ncbi:unnamed protein product [Ambrosiozyma monospora]|uniref:Unnamed protein product n=1 Tax=Ambrosiozyma monospora TaxID=43982 RepID=A0ACB5TDL8_AMBMO|nr:unnamed protein product [Ambrosiozyma monospora]